jgi:hypothetical protein
MFHARLLFHARSLDLARQTNTTRVIRLVRPPASGGKELMRKTALLEKAPSNGFQVKDPEVR